SVWSPPTRRAAGGLGARRIPEPTSATIPGPDTRTPPRYPDRSTHARAPARQRRDVPGRGDVVRALAQRDAGDLRGGPGPPVRLRRPGLADRRPHRLRAPLPAADPVGARSGGDAGVGRRGRLRPRLPRTPIRPAPAGLDGAAVGARGPDHVAAAGPPASAVGAVLGRGARGRPGRAAGEVAPGAGRRHLDRRPAPGAARHRPRAEAGAVPALAADR